MQLQIVKMLRFIINQNLYLYLLLLTTSVASNSFSWNNIYNQDQSAEEASEEYPVEYLPTESSKPVNLPIFIPGRRGYGEACNETIRCYPNSQFSCIDEKCKCSKPNEMVFVAETSKCLVVSGEKCQYEVRIEQQPNPNRVYSHRTIGMGMASIQNSRRSFQNALEYLPCVPNSDCDGGVCTCKSGYYENANGQCSEKKAFGESCTVDNECVNQPGFKCSEGVCGCDPKNSIRSDSYCVGLPLEMCIDNRCGKNSVCNGSGQCTCGKKTKYLYDEHTKECKVKYGEECSNTGDCHGSLDCINGLCNCKYTNHQIMDVTENKCVSIVSVSAPCSADQDCVPHATCVSNGLQGHTCKCSEGFVENGEGFCRSGHGSKCLNDEQSKSYRVSSLSSLAFSDNRAEMSGLHTTISSIEGCDNYRNLACRNGSCSCEPIMETFDEGRGSCVGLAGTLCRLDRKHYCGNNSECITTNKLNPENKLGTCVCISTEFMVDAERNCVKKQQ